MMDLSGEQVQPEWRKNKKIEIGSPMVVRLNEEEKLDAKMRAHSTHTRLSKYMYIHLPIELISLSLSPYALAISIYSAPQQFSYGNGSMLI